MLINSKLYLLYTHHILKEVHGPRFHQLLIPLPLNFLGGELLDVFLAELEAEDAQKADYQLTQQ